MGECTLKNRLDQYYFKMAAYLVVGHYLLLYPRYFVTVLDDYTIP